MEKPNESMSEQDRKLWKLAKKRVGFRTHLVTYLIVNAFFWATWLFTHFGKFPGDMGLGMPWPLWVTLSWGIGLAFNYYDAYHGANTGSVEKEFQKLKDKENR